MANIDKPYGFIYITTNNINGKKYIGQKNFDSRGKWGSYLGSGTMLLQSIKKSGKSAFTRNTIDIAYSQNELNTLEKYYIDEFNAVESEFYYNLIEGGDVSSGLSRLNSKKCICISNGKLFNSYEEARKYSGYNSPQLKSTFSKKHSVNFKNEPLIFRPIERLRRGKIFCKICGRAIYRRNGDSCKSCLQKVVKNLNRIDRKINNNNLTLTRDIMYDNVGANNISNYINTQKYIIEVIEKEIDKNKDKINKMYYKNNLSAKEIAKSISNTFVDEKEIKDFLKLNKSKYNGKCSVCGDDITKINNRKKYCNICKKELQKERKRKTA